MRDRSGIICAGNWIVDLVHDIEDWPKESDLVRINSQTHGIGGGPANVIGALAKLETGLPLWPMGAIGDDNYGQTILAECKALGLSTDSLCVKKGVPTAHTHVMSVSGRSRTFFYQGGANDVLAADDFPAGTFSSTDAKIFYLGYLTLLGELDRVDSNGTTEAARVLQRAQASGLITCVDLVSADRPDFEKIVTAALPFIDYLVINETEAARASGTTFDAETTLDESSFEKMGHAIVKKGVRKGVVIHSPEFAHWSGCDGGTLSFPVKALPSKHIRSHLGAGDAFCAGFLFAIHEEWELSKAILLAQATAKASLKGMTAVSAIPPLKSLEQNS